MSALDGKCVLCDGDGVAFETGYRAALCNSCGGDGFFRHRCEVCHGKGAVVIERRSSPPFFLSRRRVTKCLACYGTGRVLVAGEPSAEVRSIPPSGVPIPTQGDYPSDADILRRVARWLGFEGEVDLARVLAEIDRLRGCERELLEFKRKQTSAPTGRGLMR